MKDKALFSILLMVGMVLAGCVGGGDPTGTDDSGDPTGPAGFDAESGGIEGFVLDEESRPVVGAQVGVLQLELETTTDESGRFVFSNVAPGTYAIIVQKLGYEATSRSVDVVAGESASVQLSLVTIEVHEPYSVSIPKQGYFECTWRHLLGSGPCGYLGGLNDTTGNPVQEHVFVNSERKWNYQADPGAMNVLNEMTWTAGSAATGDNLRIFFSYANRTPSHTFCQADGFSPLTMKWERDEVDEDADWDCSVGSVGNQPSDEEQTIDLDEGLKVQTFVSVGVASVNGQSTFHGFAYDQRFEIWFSMFYWEHAPDDFSALPDA